MFGHGHQSITLIGFRYICLRQKKVGVGVRGGGVGGQGHAKGHGCGKPKDIINLTSL